MSNSFEILSRFLERFEHEVQGREQPEPPPEIQAQLRGLARGHLPQTQCAELLDLLSRNPAWIARLAEEIKAARPAAAAKP